MSGQRTSLASLAGAKVDKVPGHTDALMVRLPLDKLVPTPLNPRTNFGTADELVELGESLRKRQLQPVVVVSRVSYLALFPEHADAGGTASHVIITGERRYRGARQVDLGALSAVILEEIAVSRADVIDAVLAENIDRRNFDPIEEAHAVQTMVKECGTAVAAAERFNRTKGWVSQRLALLKLAPEVQILVRSGKMPVRDARSLAGVSADLQLRTWKERQQERAEGLQPQPLQPPGSAALVGTLPTVETRQGVPVPAAKVPTSPAPLDVPRTARTPPPPVVPGQAATEEGAGPADRVDGEPGWAAADTSGIVQLGRSLVERYSREDRQRLIDFLVSVDNQERQQPTSV